MLILLLLAAAPGEPDLDSSWPADARADQQTVARDVWDACRKLWPGKMPAGERPVRILYRAAGPLTDSTTDPKSYRIHLSISGRQYARLAYQLGHEYAHVMLDPRRTNGLVETFAVAFSLAVLDEMAVRWARRPPHAHWRTYAAEFSKYRKQTEKSHLDNFPLAVQALVERKDAEGLGLYLRYRRSDKDANPLDRDLDHLGATALLAGPLKWESITGLAGQTEPAPDADPKFRQDLLLLPEKLPDLVRRLGRNRPKAMAVLEVGKRPALRDGVVLNLPGGRFLWITEADDLDGAAVGKLIKDYSPIRLTWERGYRPAR